MQRKIPGRKIGVMGGTFDPVHHGHLVAASEVADRFGLDEVVFVPTGQPWQKEARRVSPAEERYLMTVVATASNPRFTVSRVDIDRGGATYASLLSLVRRGASDLTERAHTSLDSGFAARNFSARIHGWDAAFCLPHYLTCA